MKSKILIILGLVAGVLSAQPLQQGIYSTLPQSKFQTIGIFPEYRFYIGIPGLANVNPGISSSGFAFKDLMDGTGVSTKVTLNEMVNGLDEKNYLAVGVRNDILNFGFKFKKKNFISVNVSARGGLDVSFNKNFLGFFVLGNGAEGNLGKTVSLDGTAYNAYAYGEVGVNYSREINDKLSAGVRFKVLNGVFNASGNFDGINITTNEDDLTIVANSTFSTYNYGLTELISDDPQGVENTMPNFNNMSVALDFGAAYEVTDQLMVSANVVDLGYLKWSDGRKKYNDGSTFTYEGVSLNALTQDTAFFENFQDSITDIFELKEEREDYTTNLPTSIFLTGNYKLNDQFDFDAVFRGKIFHGKMYSAFSLGAGIKLGRILQTKLTYSVINKSYANLGIGTALNFGGFQIYAVTDNVLGFTAVDYARNLNASFGMNITIRERKDAVEKRKAKKKKKSKRKDSKDKNSKKKDVKTDDVKEVDKKVQQTK